MSGLPSSAILFRVTTPKQGCTVVKRGSLVEGISLGGEQYLGGFTVPGFVSVRVIHESDYVGSRARDSLFWLGFIGAQVGNLDLEPLTPAAREFLAVSLL